jgi:hypothetical protein
LFSSDTPFENGARVELLFPMPQETIGCRSKDGHSMGQAAEIEARGTPTSPFEVDVKFCSYEVLRQPAP